MATQILNGTGNLSNGNVFGTAETGTGALAMVRNNNTTLASNTSISSPTFTFTNGHVVDGVLLFVEATDAAPAGTLTVEIDKGGVSQAAVTVNMADLPHSATGSNDVLLPVPVFFKFTSTATGDGGTNWTIKLTTSNNAHATLTYERNSGTAGDFTKALRQTAGGNPVAGDNLYIVGELTGAGTNNAHTCTMDQLAGSIVQYGSGTVASTTVYGGEVVVSAYGTLTFGTSASTNYYFQVKGLIEIFWNGEVDAGVIGTEMPRNSSGILELVMNSAAGDFGILVRNLGTLKSAGLSRTSGKDIYKAKLTSDVTYSQVAFNNFNVGVNQLTPFAGPGVDGFSNVAVGWQDDTSTGNHSTGWTDGTSRASTQSYVAVVWLERGGNTNNRFVRLAVNGAASNTLTNAFYTDIDLQAGTASGPTAAGTATATSVSITPVGNGYLVVLIGKTGQATANNTLIVFTASALGTISFTGTTTGGFNYFMERLGLYLGTSLSDTTLNIDTDTGWLSGDAVAVAGTARQYRHNEAYVLSANAGASSIVSHLNPLGYPAESSNSTYAYAHSGTSPTQAEVILLTRNVQFRSYNPSTLAAQQYGYIYLEPLANVNCSRTQFSNFGFNSGTKYGIVCQEGAAGQTNAKSFDRCTFQGMYYWFVDGNQNNASINVSFTNNNFFMASGGFQLLNSSGASDWTLDSNIFMLGSGVVTTFFNGTITNNVYAGSTGVGYTYNNSGTNGFDPPIKNFSGNVAHGCASYGLQIGAGSAAGTPVGSISNFTAWRNNNPAVLLNYYQNDDLFFDGGTWFGNLNYNIQLNQGYILNLNNIVMASDSGLGLASGNFTTNYGIFLATGAAYLSLNNVDMSGNATGMTPHVTSDFNTQSAVQNLWRSINAVCNNVKLGTTLNTGTFPKSIWTKNGFMAFERYNGTAGDNRLETKFGQLKTDTSIFRTASPSLRMTPNGQYTPTSVTAGQGPPLFGGYESQYYALGSSYFKLRSSTPFSWNSVFGPKGIMGQCKNGQSIPVSVWVRLAAASDVPTTWSPIDKTNANYALSNGNLTVTCNQGSFGGARGTSAPRSNSLSSGKLYVEWTIANLVANTGVGICLPNTSLGGIGSSGTGAFILISTAGGTGEIWLNGVDTGKNCGAISTNVIQMAIDFTNQKGWFRIGSGNWNGDAAANPATNTNGIDLSSYLSGSPGAMPVFSCQSTSATAATANFGATSFTNTPPSGFTSWDSGQPLYVGDFPRLIQRANVAMGQTADVVLATYASGYSAAGTWVQLSAQSSVATENGNWEFIVDCSSSWGFVSLDDWFVPGMGDNDGVKYGFNGIPIVSPNPPVAVQYQIGRGAPY